MEHRLSEWILETSKEIMLMPSQYSTFSIGGHGLVVDGDGSDWNHFNGKKFSTKDNNNENGDHSFATQWEGE